MLLKIILEHFRRIKNKFKPFLLSIIGLSIVVLFSFHIFHFVLKEYSYNNFHSKKGSIYRVVNYKSELPNPYSKVAVPYGESIKNNLPEVQDYVRIISASGDNFMLNNENIRGNAHYTDPSFFDVFDFKLTSGNVMDFERKSNSVVISEKLAKIIFKNNNPVGEIVNFSKSSQQDNQVLEVVGIMKDFPLNSTIQSDFIINLALDNANSLAKGLNRWNHYYADLYLYLPLLKDFEGFENKLNQIHLKERNPAEPARFKAEYNYSLQNFTDIYLHSNGDIGLPIKGSLSFLNMLIIVGVLLISIAISNFILMNLSLKHARIKELKIKSVLGLSKLNLWKLLFTESLLTALICLVITLLVNLFFGNQITAWLGSNNTFSIINDGLILGWFVFLIVILAAIISMLEYFYIKGWLYSSKVFNSTKFFQKQSFFKLLIGIQLFLFIASLSFVLLMNKQLSFIQSYDLGFDNENIVSTWGGGNESLINELKSKSFVAKVARGSILFKSIVQYQDVTILNTQNTIQGRHLKGDNNYLAVHGFELILGRNITSTVVKKDSTPSDLKFNGEVIVSESFVKKAGITDPIGKLISSSVKDNEIVGVFKNVTHESLYTSNTPLIIGSGYGIYNFLQIKSTKNRKSELIAFLEEYYISKGTNPFDVNSQMVQYDFEKIYAKELNFGKIINVYLIVVVLISILGLIGMILFITENKTKEIGIRKVNGASIREIIFMLNKGFIKWVAVAFFIACPAAYYFMDRWLENFAYKTQFGWWLFVLAGLLTIILVLMTVSWQSYIAAKRNPVEALRNE